MTLRRQCVEAASDQPAAVDVARQQKMPLWREDV
jgi:hypothetical protein